MLSKNLKSNFFLFLLVGTILTTANGCGGEVRSKPDPDKDFKEKHTALVKMLEREGSLSDKLIEILKKVDDPSVSAKSFEEMIKKYEQKHSQEKDDHAHQEQEDPHQNQKEDYEEQQYFNQQEWSEEENQ